MSGLTNERLQEIVRRTYCRLDEGESMAAELLASRKQIESLKNELDLANKMHDVAVKERDYERRVVKSLMAELNRKS